MGRSVSYASYSVYKEYDELEEAYEWEDYVEDKISYLKELFPSLTDEDKWLGREDHALLSNAFVYVGVSEYCGLACWWMTPRYEHSNSYYDNRIINLADQWIKQAGNKFSRVGTLNKLGTFSNGESIYKTKQTG